MKGFNEGLQFCVASGGEFGGVLDEEPSKGANLESKERAQNRVFTFR